MSQEKPVAVGVGILATIVVISIPGTVGFTATTNVTSVMVGVIGAAVGAVGSVVGWLTAYVRWYPNFLAYDPQCAGTVNGRPCPGNAAYSRFGVCAKHVAVLDTIAPFDESLYRTWQLPDKVEVVVKTMAMDAKLIDQRLGDSPDSSDSLAIQRIACVTIPDLVEAWRREPFTMRSDAALAQDVRRLHRVFLHHVDALGLSEQAGGDEYATMSRYIRDLLPDDDDGVLDMAKPYTAAKGPVARLGRGRLHGLAKWNRSTAAPHDEQV